jgi:hypothetical protein
MIKRFQAYANPLVLHEQLLQPELKDPTNRTEILVIASVGRKKTPRFSLEKRSANNTDGNLI